MSQKNQVLIHLFIIIFLILNTVSWAQEQNPVDEYSNASAENIPIIETLNTLLWTRNDLENKLEEKQQALKTTTNEIESKEILSEIDELKLKIESIDSDYEKVATGMDVKSLEGGPQTAFDWQQEVLKLLEPLIQEINKLTAKPRQIEKIRGKIEYLNNWKNGLENGRQNIENLIAALGDTNKSLKNDLLQIKDAWTLKENNAQDQIKVLQFQLNELTAQKESFLESTSKSLKSFFRNRGRNLFFAFMAFFIVFIVLRFVHRLIYKFSPIHRSGERSFIIRLLDVVYYLFTAIGSLGAVIAIFYLSGDWLLLSFAILFFLGLAWAAKEGLPAYWKQIQTMLNLGTVRENERVIYLDVPWRIGKLSFFAELTNPMFRPDFLRIPIRYVMELNSRQFDESEPWFPSDIGEWVILSDGTRGEVINQNHEMVVLRQRGGSQKTYLAQDYLGLSPLNLSKNFRIKVVFGLDYDHQSIITTQVPKIFTDALKQGIIAKGFEDYLIQVKVEIEAAGASSIDLLVIADFDGKAAALYNSIKRMIQCILIDACTENNWGIPFPQLTIHAPEIQVSASDR